MACCILEREVVQEKQKLKDLRIKILKKGYSDSLSAQKERMEAHLNDLEKDHKQIHGERCVE